MAVETMGIPASAKAQKLGKNSKKRKRLGTNQAQDRRATVARGKENPEFPPEPESTPKPETSPEQEWSLDSGRTPTGVTVSGWNTTPELDTTSESGSTPEHTPYATSKIEERSRKLVAKQPRFDPALFAIPARPAGEKTGKASPIRLSLVGNFWDIQDDTTLSPRST